MKDPRINQLHAIAEFQKRMAWHHARAAQRSTMFKTELEDIARQCAQQCRETRQAIRNIIWHQEDEQLQLQWAESEDPDKFWD